MIWHFLGIPLVLFVLSFISKMNDWDPMDLLSTAFGILASMIVVLCIILMPEYYVETRIPHSDFTYAQNGVITAVAFKDGSTYTSDKAWFYNKIQDPKSSIIIRVGVSDVGLHTETDYHITTE